MSTSNPSVPAPEDTALLFSLRSLSVYRALLQNGVVENLMRLLGDDLPPLQAAACYGSVLHALQEAGMSLCDYIYSIVLYDSNVFTQLSSRGLPPGNLLSAVRHDLRALAGLAYLQPADIKSRLCARYPSLGAQIDALPDFPVGHRHFLADESDWSNEIDALREFCIENGCGDEARRQLLRAV